MYYFPYAVRSARILVYFKLLNTDLAELGKSLETVCYDSRFLFLMSRARQ